MRNEDKIPDKIFRLFKKILRRKAQDIERGTEKPRQFYTLFSHKIEKEDLTGDPKKLGKIVPSFDPNVPSSETELSFYFAKRFQRWLLGKRPPQKRVRPKHDRDKKLTRDPKEMDRLVFNEIEKIENDKEFAKADVRARKRYTQAKYRYPRTTAKKTS